MVTNETEHASSSTILCFSIKNFELNYKKYSAHHCLYYQNSKANKIINYLHVKQQIVK